MNDITMNKIKDFYWNIMEGHISEFEGALLHYIASQASAKGVIVEIGCWKGKSTTKLASGSIAGPKVKVYAIDHHLGSQNLKIKGKRKSSFPDFKSNIDYFGFKKVIIPIHKKSENAVKTFKKPISLLFIDGDHSYRAVKKDLELWFPKVIKGSTIVFHDNISPGPERVLKEYVRNNPSFSKVKDFGIITTAIKEGRILIKLK